MYDNVLISIYPQDQVLSDGLTIYVCICIKFIVRQFRAVWIGRTKTGAPNFTRKHRPLLEIPSRDDVPIAMSST